MRRWRRTKFSQTQTWHLANASQNNHGLLPSSPSTLQQLLAGSILNRQEGWVNQGKGQHQVSPTQRVCPIWARRHRREVDMRTTFGVMVQVWMKILILRKTWMKPFCRHIFIQLKFLCEVLGATTWHETETAFLICSLYQPTMCTLCVEFSNKCYELVTWPTICKRLQYSGLPNEMEQAGAGNSFSWLPYKF